MEGRDEDPIDGVVRVLRAVDRWTMRRVVRTRIGYWHADRLVTYPHACYLSVRA